jgi:carbon-monoxide dehydrogenase large subunit
MSWVGSRVKRVEDPALLMGQGRFVDDLHMPGMVQATILRSNHAHARIRGIDAAAARAMPGVHGVFTAADLPPVLHGKLLPLLAHHPAIRHVRTAQILAQDEVRYVGEPIAVVVADDRYLAEDAAERVVVDYEPLAVVADCRAALENPETRAHADLEDNLTAEIPLQYGASDAAFAAAAHVVRERLFQNRGGAQALECRAVLALPDPAEDGITLWANTQAPHRLRRVLADLFEVPEERFRVIAEDVGGGFGPKGSSYPEQIAIPACARLLGRPVKWIEDRREHFITAFQERDQYWDVELALDGDGRILGLRGEVIHDGGAYLPMLGVVLPYITGSTVPGPYVIPAFDLTVKVACTNMISCSPVRGAGRPQAVFAMERLMDRAAREMKLDPAEIRRRNFIQPEQMPYAVGLTYRDGSPLTYDSGDYPESQRLALEAAGYDNFPKRQAAAREAGRYLGIGVGNYVEGTGLGPFEGVTVSVGAGGKITAVTGASAQGQGHQTMLAQIVADGLGARIEDIEVRGGDTAKIPHGVGTFASRVTVNAGSSAQIAAAQLREKILKTASHMLEAAAEDLDLAEGRIFVKGVPDMGISLAEVEVFSNGRPGFSMPPDLSPGLRESAYFTPERSTYTNGCHVAEVEVDVETGEVTILNYVAGHDCGKVINPLIVDGQVIGGVAHGIGNALYEWMHYDSEGQPLTTNFGEYLMPLASDMPPLSMVHLETPTPLNPLGVKGAGEGGTIPAPAAIAAAIEDALLPFDVRIAQVPVTPPYLLSLLDGKV